jgi:hypothetical protein
VKLHKNNIDFYEVSYEVYQIQNIQPESAFGGTPETKEKE